MTWKDRDFTRKGSILFFYLFIVGFIETLASFVYGDLLFAGGMFWISASLVFGVWCLFKKLPSRFVYEKRNEVKT